MSAESTAEKNGIRPGDVILSCQGVVVSTISQVTILGQMWNMWYLVLHFFLSSLKVFFLRFVKSNMR